MESSGSHSFLDGFKELLSGCLQTLGGFIITDLIGDVIQPLEKDAGVEKLLGVGERFEFFIGGHHVFVAVAFALAAFGIDEGFREVAGAVVVDVGDQVVPMKAVHEVGKALGDVAVADEFANHRGVLGLDQRVVVAMPWTRLGELDAELFQEPGDLAIDILRAVVGMESEEDEGERSQEGFQGRDEKALGDSFDGDDDLHLGDFVDDVDVIEPFDAVPIALVNGVDAQETGATLGIG